MPPIKTSRKPSKRSNNVDDDTVYRINIKRTIINIGVSVSNTIIPDIHPARLENVAHMFVNRFRNFETWRADMNAYVATGHAESNHPDKDILLNYVKNQLARDFEGQVQKIIDDWRANLPPAEPGVMHDYQINVIKV